MDPTSNEPAGPQPIALPLPPPPPPPAPAPGAAPAAGPDSAVPAQPPQAASPAIIDDGDLIEKEWVTKAKQIVASNRSDPYKQSEELMIFRADYMKKRYGKNIKLSK